MCLEIACRAKALVAHLALVRLFARVHQMVLLEVRQLGKTFGANVTMEGPLAGVRPQVDLQIGQLAKGFEAPVALVMHFAVLLAQGIGQRLVAPRALARGAASGRQRARA